MSDKLLSTATPLISVVMPVYNAGPTLTAAIRSVQEQTYPDWELIVVDDGSTDGSGELAGELAARDARLSVLRMEHGGAAQAVNAGVELARGPLMARMDADDIAIHVRLAVQLAWMRRTGVEVCGSWVKRFGSGSGLIWFPETHQAIAREMLFRHGLLQPTVLMPTAVFRSHRYRDGTRFEGNDLWNRLLTSARLGNVPAVLLKHRCHPAQTHVVHGPAMAELQRSTRRELLGRLFEDADEPVAQLLDRVAGDEPASDLAELAWGGAWLARIANCPDAILRRRMLMRWRRWCRRSALLGPGVYRAYRHLEPRFDVGTVGGDMRLRAACAARVAPGPRVGGSW